MLGTTGGTTGPYRPYFEPLTCGNAVPSVRFELTLDGF